MSLFRNPPATQYVDTGQGWVGYQVFGHGWKNVLFNSSINHNVEAVWDIPQAAQYFDRLSSFCRVAFFDPRGHGTSDPVPGSGWPTFESITDDTTRVMDAAGFSRATVIGDTEGGSRALYSAAAFPNRIESLVLLNSAARLSRSDDYPIGIPARSISKLRQNMASLWGTPDFVSLTAPSLQDDLPTRTQIARYQRLSNSPGVVDPVVDFYRSFDVRWILPSIQVPTLVICRKDAVHHRATYSRYLADNIPGAELVELEGGDTAPFFIGDTEAVLAAIELFVAGETSMGSSQRKLATVMFTDIVDSSGMAADMGDARWLDQLDRHHRLARQYIQRYNGREVKTTGDGFLATFDGPTRAVTCAANLVKAMIDIGLQVRAGLHTGEIEEDASGDIGGLAVHIAARVASSTPAAGVIVSSTVKQLLVGSQIDFESVGEHNLKGIPGTWDLYTLDTKTASPLVAAT